MSERGYDPAKERFGKLMAMSSPYYPVCGVTGGVELPHPKTFMRIENQGSWPSCGGHGLSTLIEYLYYLATNGTQTQLSRMFGWVESQRVDGKPSPKSGVSIYSCVVVAKTIGLPLESLAPYKVGDWYDDFGPDVLESAAQHKALHSYELDTVEKIFDYQAAGMGGILWGVPWDFNRSAWHAVTTIGTPIDGKLCGANSWGPDWDEDGWFDWSPDTVAKFLRISGTVAVGLSDLDTPQVRAGWDWNKGGLV